MRKIIYTLPNAGVAVVTPVRNTTGEPLVGVVIETTEGSVTELQPPTDAYIEQRAWDRLPAGAINPCFVDEADIPEDRTFRDAWVQTGKACKVDMPKAVEIHKDALRAMRQPLLKALDGEFLKALESGDTQAQKAIAAKKQALRDVTADPALLEATTPEELKAVVPDILT